MFFRLSLGAGLIAATVVIQALFMSVGLNIFKRIEERRPGAMARKPAITTVIWILFLLIPIVQRHRITQGITNEDHHHRKCQTRAHA